MHIRHKLVGSALALTLALTGLAGPKAQLAAADTTAQTDDHSVSAPTANWWYTGLTTAQVQTKLTANGARLTQVESDSATTFTVRMVKNSGAYAVSGWWWYVGLTGAQVSANLATNSARLIHLHAYTVSGSQRFAAVMVANTGSQARAWWWLANTDATTIGNFINTNNARIVTLQSYLVGATREYLAVYVSNTGSDAKGWHFYPGLDPALIGTTLTTTGDRLVILSRRTDGFADVVSYHDKSQFDFSSYSSTSLTGTQVNEELTRTGTRPVDLHRTPAGTFDLVTIDNLNKVSGRVRTLLANHFSGARMFGAYLKEVGGPVDIASADNAIFEPASAIKVLYYAYAWSNIAAGTEHTTDTFTYYRYAGANQAKVCPDPTFETQQNLTTTTLANALNLMMTQSHNAITRGFQLRYGSVGVSNWAHLLGLSNSTIRQILGCAFQNNLRNDFTLDDAGKIYELVENGTLLGNGTTAQSGFWANLLGGTPSANGTFAKIVQQEAAIMGMSAKVPKFVAATTFKSKGGSYDICGNVCGPFVYIRSTAGRVILPYRATPLGSLTSKSYVYGAFVDGLTIPCAIGCQTELTADANFNSDAMEVLRAEIHKLLINF